MEGIELLALIIAVIVMFVLYKINDNYKKDIIKKNELTRATQMGKEVKEVVEEDNEEMVAVITAAIAASLSRPISEIVVRNIVRIPQNTPVWAMAARQEQTSLG